MADKENTPPGLTRDQAYELYRKTKERGTVWRLSTSSGEFYVKEGTPDVTPEEDALIESNPDLFREAMMNFGQMPAEYQPPSPFGGSFGQIAEEGSKIKSPPGQEIVLSDIEAFQVAAGKRFAGVPATFGAFGKIPPNFLENYEKMRQEHPTSTMLGEAVGDPLNYLMGFGGKAAAKAAAKGAEKAAAPLLSRAREAIVEYLRRALPAAGKYGAAFGAEEALQPGLTPEQRPIGGVAGAAAGVAGGALEPILTLAARKAQLGAERMVRRIIGASKEGREAAARLGPKFERFGIEPDVPTMAQQSLTSEGVIPSIETMRMTYDPAFGGTGEFSKKQVAQAQKTVLGFPERFGAEPGREIDIGSVIQEGLEKELGRRRVIDKQLFDKEIIEPIQTQSAKIGEIMDANIAKAHGDLKALQEKRISGVLGIEGVSGPTDAEKGLIEEIENLTAMRDAVTFVKMPKLAAKISEFRSRLGRGETGGLGAYSEGLTEAASRLLDNQDFAKKRAALSEFGQSYGFAGSSTPVSPTEKKVFGELYGAAMDDLEGYASNYGLDEEFKFARGWHQKNVVPFYKGEAGKALWSGEKQETKKMIAKVAGKPKEFGRIAEMLPPENLDQVRASIINEVIKQATPSGAQAPNPVGFVSRMEKYLGVFPKAFQDEMKGFSEVVRAMEGRGLFLIGKQRPTGQLGPEAFRKFGPRMIAIGAGGALAGGGDTEIAPYLMGAAATGGGIAVYRAGMAKLLTSEFGRRLLTGISKTTGPRREVLIEKTMRYAFPQYVRAQAREREMPEASNE